MKAYGFKGRKPSFGSIGSVSSGTMRNQDLIPLFLWECRRLRLTRDERNAVRKIDSRVSRVSNDDDAYWSDAVSQWDLEELFDILDAHSLPYFHFGAHEGDGADFGWWLSESFEEDFDGLKVCDLSGVPGGHSGEVLHVNDHGNLALYVYSRGRRREIWGVV
jgi:hypothetical protein